MRRVSVAAPSVAGSSPAPATRTRTAQAHPALHILIRPRPSHVLGAGLGPTFAQRYEIVRQLGRGGMGVVYLAKDTRLERDVALKIPFFWGDEDPEFLHRFYREARAAAGLRHPNICRVFDVGEHEGQPYLTMEYLEGVLLSEHLERRRRRWSRRRRSGWCGSWRRYGSRASAGDHPPRPEAGEHHAGPEAGSIVMDFGLARREYREDSLRTRAGQQLGTPAYMPLEQFQGKVDASVRGATSTAWG